MTPQESDTGEYYTEKIIRPLKTLNRIAKYAIGFGISPVLYYGALMHGNELALRNGKPIATQQQLESQISVEKKKPDCGKQVSGRLVEYKEGGSSLPYLQWP